MKNKYFKICVVLGVVILLVVACVYFYFYKKEYPTLRTTEEVACETYNSTYGQEYGPYNSVEVFDLATLFGEGTESSKYIVYIFTGGYAKTPINLYVAVNKDNLTSFPINNTTAYNRLTSTLDYHVEVNNAVNITHAYLELIPLIPPEILWELPNETGEENYTTFNEWFESHNYTFHSPTVNSTGGGYIIEYYAWQIIGGELSYHHFELKIDGTIVSWERTILGWNVGPYITP